ncbi:MAG: hypothetical protein ACD_48C00168G0005 [uncultured bacterium]|nr:MAG: hypothetical protein ACD_48C00168G0005 [uncultured bacterium]
MCKKIGFAAVPMTMIGCVVTLITVNQFSLSGTLATGLIIILTGILLAVLMMGEKKDGYGNFMIAAIYAVVLFILAIFASYLGILWRYVSPLQGILAGTERLSMYTIMYVIALSGSLLWNRKAKKIQE